MGFVACDCDENQAEADTARGKSRGDKERTGCALQGCGSEGKGRKQSASECSLCCSGSLGLSLLGCSHLFEHPPKPLKRARNSLRCQNHSTRAVLGSSRPGQLSLPAALWGHWVAPVMLGELVC